MAEEPTFFHRAIVTRWTKAIPRCADCGEPSRLELIEITTFGDAASHLIEQPTNRCPNGPHYVEEARRG